MKCKLNKLDDLFLNGGDERGLGLSREKKIDDLQRSFGCVNSFFEINKRVVFADGTAPISTYPLCLLSREKVKVFLPNILFLKKNVQISFSDSFREKNPSKKSPRFL